MPTDTSAYHADIQQLAIRQILDEHRGIVAALDGIATALEGGQPDLDAVAALLTYLEAFPEDIHHPKEESLLFAILAERTERAKALLAALRAEHQHCTTALARLRDLLDDAHSREPLALLALRTAFGGFAGFYRAHMRLEEEGLLPLAREHLHADDWARIDASFATNLDPMASRASAEALQSMLKGALSRLHAGTRRSATAGQQSRG